MPTAIVTGASRGLGAALARRLSADGWSLVLDARGAPDLEAVAAGLGGAGRVVALAGDVTDPGHRRDLVEAARSLGGLDALVNNAGGLGPSPLPPLTALAPADLRALLEVNVVAPLALVGAAAGLLRESDGGGRVLNVTSDAGREAYPGWGGYGATKAALEQASRVLAVEEPRLRVYVVDPGDMRTRMHQDAYPGEDISDRPEPEASVPGLVVLLTADLPGGRYSTADLAPA